MWRAKWIELALRELTAFTSKSSGIQTMQKKSEFLHLLHCQYLSLILYSSNFVLIPFRLLFLLFLPHLLFHSCPVSPKFLFYITLSSYCFFLSYIFSFFPSLLLFLLFLISLLRHIVPYPSTPALMTHTCALRVCSSYIVWRNITVSGM
jgi:hypothetical protein